MYRNRSLQAHCLSKGGRLYSWFQAKPSWHHKLRIFVKVVISVTNKCISLFKEPIHYVRSLIMSSSQMNNSNKKPYISDASAPMEDFQDLRIQEATKR